MQNNEEIVKYQVKIDSRPSKFLDKLDDYKFYHILEEILNLETNPRPVGCSKLNYKDGYRIKWSTYRILFTVDDYRRTVVVYKIAHRKDAYKKKK